MSDFQFSIVHGECLGLSDGNANINSYPARLNMPYADNVAPDQPAHPRSLTCRLHCPLISQRDNSIYRQVYIVALRSDCRMH